MTVIRQGGRHHIVDELAEAPSSGENSRMQPAIARDGWHASLASTGSWTARLLEEVHAPHRHVAFAQVTEEGTLVAGSSKNVNGSVPPGASVYCLDLAVSVRNAQATVDCC